MRQVSKVLFAHGLQRFQLPQGLLPRDVPAVQRVRRRYPEVIVTLEEGQQMKDSLVSCVARMVSTMRRTSGVCVGRVRCCLHICLFALPMEKKQ